MLMHVLFISPTASFTAIYETVVFAFLSFNTYDKTDDPPLALPFLVLIAYFGTIFIFGACQCIKCYRHSDYLDSRTRCAGAVANFFILLLALALICVGALADNNLILQDWPPLLKNFSLYIFAALAIGTA